MTARTTMHLPDRLPPTTVAVVEQFAESLAGDEMTAEEIRPQVPPSVLTAIVALAEEMRRERAARGRPRTLCILGAGGSYTRRVTEADLDAGRGLLDLTI